MRPLVGFFACAALLLWPAEAPADPPPAAPTGVAALGWLEGSWRSAGEGAEGWEACYSGPEGGEIVSATKQIKDGRVVLFDFERFREEDGKVILTPFPHGRASVDFPLVAHDPAAKRAIFANPEHDFPQRLRYELTAPDRLTISLAAERDGKHVGFTLELVRKGKE